MLATKKEEIDIAKSLAISKQALPSLPIYNFYSALREKFPAVIAECKKGSPSAGIIRSNYNPVEIAKIYQGSGASAISVLTDSRYFHGSLNDLAKVSEAVQIPVIRKDFIIDPIQIDEARRNGASAILLIVRILEPDQLKNLLDYAHALGLGVLVETHNKQEVELAVSVGAQAIGINTRDLDTFEIYPKLIQELASLIPQDRIIIGESGIHSKSDWKDLEGVVQGLLVGTYFMNAEDISLAYKNLFS
ncbi:MAG: indole-3-glycerol phosphate synthase TrpC [Leptospiraceae bacterium]|nr:indole-3-glycerol phosphate synthase TrpC [Leptospiraceae bacterium]MCZ8345677.1 indole-3-glycerol phosphate synthase TrpC [Leptospiraceae bacterium]